MNIEHISAVTLAVRDMQRSVDFYRKLGLEPTYDAVDGSFVSLRSAQAYVNLILTAGHSPKWWGRVIFRVRDADAQYQALRAAGLHPDRPQDAPWGERYFHLTDPDGHELSFAQLR